MELTIQAGLAGIHPRSEDLVQATRDLDRGRADAKQVQEVRRRDAQALVEAQVKAGFPYASDGLLGFQDLFRPFAERLKGARAGPLTRWFDNNTFYRRPVVEAPVRRRGSILEPYLERVALPRGHRWKAILPGPYTFAKLAEDRAYGSPDRLLSAFAREALAPEVRWLAQHGFGFVQFSEPWLLRERPRPEELDALQKAYLTILDGARVTSSVVTCFGDASRLLPELFGLPVDLVGIDFTETPIDALADFPATRGIQAGLADARSSLVEEPEALVAAGEEILEAAPVPALLLAPSAELEHLPRDLADRKLATLGQAARLLEEGVHG